MPQSRSKKSSWLRASLFLFSQFLFSAFPATTYYVSPSGSDTNTGLSIDSPWTVAYALTQVSGTNTLVFMDGEYAAIRLATSTFSGMTFIAQHKWAAIITNAADIGFETADGTHHLTLDGLVVTNGTAAGIKVNGNFNVVRNCWVTHCGDQGIASHSSLGLPADDCTFENNLSEYNGDARGEPAAQGHGLFVSGARLIIRNNVCRFNGGYGIQVYPEDNSQNVECHVYNNLVYSNQFGGAYGGGIVIYTDTATNFMATNHIWGNTVIEPVASDGCIKVKYGYANIINNILVGAIRIEVEGGVVVRADYNMSTDSISPAGPHDVITSYIGFVSINAGRYWLKANSPARGAALATVHGPVNFFGTNQTSVTDIGAFQYSADQAGDTRTLDPSPTNGANYWLTITNTHYGPPDYVPPYYVSPSGSDTNTGLSTDSPWTLKYALTQVGSTDTLVFMDGQYASISLKSTAFSGMTFIAQHKWGAIINAADIGFETADGTHHLTLDGLAVTNATSDGIKVNGNFNTVRNCWVTHCGDQGIASHSSLEFPANDCTFENNLSEYNGDARSGPADQGHGFYIGGHRCIIRNNVARYNGGYGIQVYPEDNSQNAECHVYNNLVYSNQFAGAFGGGIVIYTDTATNALCTNYVYGNTVVEPYASEGALTFRFGFGFVTNNILVSPYFRIQAQGGATTWADYNAGNDTIEVSGGHDVVTNYIGFVTTNDGRYWLKSDSPARGAALASVHGPVNFFGTNQTSVTDIGAFQYSADQAGDTRTLDPSPTNGANYWLTISNAQVTGPLITSINVTNRVAVITWTATAGKTYRLQYKAELTDSDWTDFSPDILATSPTAVHTNVVGDLTRLYRILLVQ